MTLTYTIPYTAPRLTFLQIINSQITYLNKDITSIKQSLVTKRLCRKFLTLQSLKIQRRNFKVKKIPMGVSSKTKVKFNPKSKSKITVTPEDMIAAMTPADRLAMVQMLTKQQGGSNL